MAITNVQKTNFLNMLIPIAQEQAKKHGFKLFPSVCIAQAIQESGWGTSAKMVKANALYGVKVGKSAYKFGTAWKGKAYKTGTHEYYDGKTATYIQDYFREYDSVPDATEDYMDMLCHCSRYKGALNRATPEESIKAIVAGGYATGPSYASHIIQIIKSNALERYDRKGALDNPYKRTLNIMKQGSIGESVKWLQYELNKHGANLAVDGRFGVKTKLAVILYQKDHGLGADGIAGPKTINNIINNQ